MTAAIKTVAADVFRPSPRRPGVAGAKLKDEDYITDLIHTSAHALCSSPTGARCTPGASDPQRTALPSLAIVNPLRLQPDEKIQTTTPALRVAPVPVFVTATRGQEDAVNASDTRQDGLIAINLRDGDELVRAADRRRPDPRRLRGRPGHPLPTDVRPMGRTASGVRGMKLRPGQGAGAGRRRGAAC